MTILNSIRKGRNYEDQLIERVSDAELNNTIFFEQREIVDPLTGAVKDEVLNKVDTILKSKGLTVVKRAMKECRNGNYRSFIGSINYQPITTAIE